MSMLILRVLFPALFLSLSVPFAHHTPDEKQKEKILLELEERFESTAIFDNSQKKQWKKSYPATKDQVLKAENTTQLQAALDKLSKPWTSNEVSELKMKESLNPYVGFNQLMMNEGFNIHLPRDQNEKIILIQWKSFSANYEKELENFIRFARSNKFLDHRILVDMRYAKGKAPSSFLVHKLFGNNIKGTQLIVSNTSDSKKYFKKLNTKEAKVILAQLKQSKDKSVSFSTELFGIEESTQPIFTGKKVIITGPDQGSAAHEMLSLISDNDLAPIIGMPSRGIGYRFLNSKSVFEDISFTWPLAQVKRVNGKLLHDSQIGVDVNFPYTDPSDYQIIDRAIELIK